MKPYRFEYHDPLPRDASRIVMSAVKCMKSRPKFFLHWRQEFCRWPDWNLTVAWPINEGVRITCAEFLSRCPAPVAWPSDEGARFGCACTGFLSRCNQWLGCLHWSQLQLHHALRKVNWVVVFWQFGSMTMLRLLSIVASMWMKHIASISPNWSCYHERNAVWTCNHPLDTQK